MRVTIRKTKDMDIIEALDREIFQEDKGLDTRTNKARVWWVLKVDGEVAGFAGLTVVPTDDGPYGFLARAGIREPFRGRGLQRKLIQVRDQEARRRGLPQVITYTAGWNVRSANNLIKCGYLMYSPETRFAGLADAIYWSKRFKYRSA